MLSGFTYGKHKEFVDATIDLGRSIEERKLHLVYGGGNRGLSKLVVVQILLNSQVHKSIVEYINGDECRSHEELDFNCV